MISRYSRPAMAARFSDQARMDTWLRVERAALAALVAEDIAPREALIALEAVDHVDVQAVQRREAQIHHDLAAFVDVVGDAAPGAAGWLHYGLTSSDVVDTALALQLSDAGDLIVEGLDALRAAVLQRAVEHRDTPMLGRTHGMPAETITFGAKLAGWWHQLTRDQVRIGTALEEIRAGKLSGAVGMYSGVGPSVEHRTLQALGLQRDPSATQVVQRDRHAQLIAAFAILASTLDRIAIEVRHLQRADVAEAHEAFAATQKGSSAMPHKRNPIISERLSGCARIIRSHVEIALQDIPLWHERDISHSSAERVMLPDAFILLDYMLDKATWLVGGLVVDADRMRANVAGQRGLVASQRVLLALIEAGAVRDTAYRSVQAAAHAVLDDPEETLDRALARDEDVIAVLDAAELARLCDPAFVPPGVDAIFEELDTAVAVSA